MLWCVVSSDVVRSAHHVTRHNTSIHNILSTAPQLSISQKALRTLPEDANVMPKHVGATIHNTRQHDFAVKSKIGYFNGNRCPESENDVSFFISRLVVAQFCFLMSIFVRFNAEKCSLASLLIIQLYNFGCDFDSYTVHYRLSRD